MAKAIDIGRLARNLSLAASTALAACAYTPQTLIDRTVYAPQGMTQEQAKQHDKDCEAYAKSDVGQAVLHTLEFATFGYSRRNIERTTQGAKDRCLGEEG